MSNRSISAAGDLLVPFFKARSTLALRRFGPRRRVITACWVFSILSKLRGGPRPQARVLLLNTTWIVRMFRTARTHQRVLEKPDWRLRRPRRFWGRSRASWFWLQAIRSIPRESAPHPLRHCVQSAHPRTPRVFPIPNRAHCLPPSAGSDGLLSGTICRAEARSQRPCNFDCPGQTYTTPCEPTPRSSLSPAAARSSRVFPRPVEAMKLEIGKALMMLRDSGVPLAHDTNDIKRLNRQSRRPDRRGVTEINKSDGPRDRGSKHLPSALSTPHFVIRPEQRS